MANTLCRNPLLWLTCLLLPGISLADDFSRMVSDIESQYGGRLGGAAFDSRDGRQLGYREHDTFAMCSTFKALLAAAVLKKAEQGQLNLNAWCLMARAIDWITRRVTRRLAGWR